MITIRGFRMLCELTERFTDSFGTLHCVELQHLEIPGFTDPCHALVEEIAKELEQLFSQPTPYLN